MKKFILLLLCLSACMAKGQEALDSIQYKQESYTFRPKQLVLPLSLTALGALGIRNCSLNSLNNKVKDGMDDWRGNHRMAVDDYIQYLPALSHLGISLLDAKTKYPSQDRIIATATSYMIMGILVNPLKWTVNQCRPNSSASNSFPSGHTATAFMGAELVRLAYGDGSPWYGVGAYALASSVAFFRLYNGKHWLNDVIAGAGIGIFSARAGYWLLPYGRKLLKTDDKNVTFLPFCESEMSAWGAAVAIRF